MKYQFKIKEQAVIDEAVFLKCRQILQALGVVSGSIAIPSFAFLEAKQWAAA